MKTSRRGFLKFSAGLAGTLAWSSPGLRREVFAGIPREGESSTALPVAIAFKTRGVVLIPEDFSLRDWPERAARAALTTLAVHHGASPQAVVKFVESESGQAVLELCRRLSLELEYELHAMKELLPRDLFSKDRSFFRMDEKGERVPDVNCCVHSSQALEIIAENAVRLAGKLRPTTGRYFFWGDDGAPWCRCPQCRGLSNSDQALVVENRVVEALRRFDARGALAHLAYANTLQPPSQVKPHSAVFLEYAPIQRRYDVPYARQTDAGAADSLSTLDANLKVFPAATAQVLEYWLDVSRFSHWQRPAKRLPWIRDVFVSDLRTYASRGIRHVTTFAAWIDADYVRTFGEPAFIDEYGQGFAEAGL
jgi:hypothetical protein